MLSASQAIDQAKELKQAHEEERPTLDLIRRYWKGVQQLPAVIPSSTPREVRVMARIARINICPIVLESLSQSLYVDGFKTLQGANAAVWEVWQRNKLDARQKGIHRAAFAYGASYAVVLPGKPVPVIRGVSPRSLIAMYGDDPDWPELALERRGGGLWRLYDDQAVYYLQEFRRRPNQGENVWQVLDTRRHGAGVTPVVRYLDEVDFDADNDVTPDGNAFVEESSKKPMRGQVADLMALQDQADLTTFNLLVAQHYAAFRQRWAIGWVPSDEAQRMKAAASQLWTFDESPEDMKLGEFEQTDLKGYLENREMILKYAATLSQTPVHELVGELVNLSAEALAAAEAGHDRKVEERETILGESHEQTLRLAATYMGTKAAVPQDAEVVWRDTSARTFAATVDGLGKLAEMLGVPAQELWSRIPGVTQQDVERWKAAAQTQDAFGQLAAIIDRHANPAPPPPAR